MTGKRQTNKVAASTLVSAFAASAAVRTAALAEGYNAMHTSTVLPEAQALAQIDAALAILPVGGAAHDALTAQREVAAHALAVAQENADTLAAQAAEIEQVRTLALPAETIAALVSAIEARYAPLPEVAPEPAPEVAPTRGKVPNANTIARNTEVAQALASDTPLAARATATIEAWYASDSRHVVGVWPQAGTRYASMAALASESEGVANAADYVTLATAVRIRLAQAPYKLKAGGQSVASVPWLAALGNHAPGADKGSDTLRLKFSDNREVAQYPNGRFKLARPGTPDVRFIRTDSAAYAAFTGTAPTAPTQAPTAPSAAPKAPTAPTPPTGSASAPSAPSAPSAAPEVAPPTARCQNCTKRNLLTAPECANCHLTEWRAD
jgi:hypothetical protein